MPWRRPCANTTPCAPRSPIRSPRRFSRLQGRRVKLIGNFGVGYNHIDVAAAGELGIRVSNTPDVLTDTTADLAILLMLMATRRAGEGERELRGGQMDRLAPHAHDGTGTAGQDAGPDRLRPDRAGHGATRAPGFRHAHRVQQPPSRGRRPSRPNAAPGSSTPWTSWSPASDVISLHCPGGAADTSPDQCRTPAPHETLGRAGQHRARHGGGRSGPGAGTARQDRSLPPALMSMSASRW